MWSWLIFFIEILLPIFLCVIFYKKGKKIWIAILPAYIQFFVAVIITLSNNPGMPIWYMLISDKLYIARYGIIYGVLATEIWAIWSLICILFTIIFRFFMNKRKRISKAD